MGQTWEYREPHGTWQTYGNLKIAANNKIRIVPCQPINSKVFDDAIVLEYNGAITKEGLKEYKSPFIKEGDYKPIIDFIDNL